ncbi:MAG TPA: PIN domain-containing protein [Caulobacteraceae bacterium]|nr:PIN domain-containing protein [Caulobacteraceae bacterium]
MLDTNVAIHLRDRDPEVMRKVVELDDAAIISIVTRVELEGGVHRDPSHAAIRRASLDAMLESLPTVEFEDAAADAYRSILEATGFARRKVLDRMIAAQAIVHHVTLVTMNATDFADIPGLRMVEW